MVSPKHGDTIYVNSRCCRRIRRKCSNVRPDPTVLLLCAFAVLAVALSDANAASAKPNILIILVDDMGFSDPGYIGGEAETPNLDKLSEEGVTFLNCFNNAKCAPTRAALMSGMSCQRVKAFKSRGDISANNAACIAEVLGANGYETIISGKWHVAPDPMDAGFQHQLGVKLMPYYFKPDLKRDGKLAPINRDGNPIDLDALPEDWFSTTVYTDYGIEMIQEHALKKDKPFFLYLAYNAPHFPLSATEEDLKKYVGRYEDGAEIARQRRYERMVQKGIVDPDVWKLPPYVVDKAKEFVWKELTEKEQKMYKRKLELTAAMVDRVDEELGKLFKFLKDSGEFDNTLIFFLSDNGSCAEQGIYGGVQFDDISMEDIDTMGTQHGVPGGTPGAMSVVHNTPLRGNKTTLWDGGMRTSMIVNWPGHMSPAAVESFVHEPVAIFDITPTCYAAAGIEYPDHINDRSLNPMDGTDFLPVLQGKSLPDRNLCFMYNSGRVLRNTKWKLFGEYNVSKEQAGHWALYDLNKDRSEMNDVSAQHPEVVKRLSAEWDKWDESVGCIAGYREYSSKKQKSKQ